MPDSANIRVAILDDHQSIIDGYHFRLNQAADIQVVAAARYANELEKLLPKTKPDVLILDVAVPVSPENANAFPILSAITQWKAAYPKLKVLIISMHKLRTLVSAVMDAGASGYVLKDDRATILKLDSVIHTVANGGVYFSKPVYDILRQQGQPAVRLTPSQMKVLSICATYPDATNYELSVKMDINYSTFRNTLSGAYERLEVHNRAAAISKAIQLGLLPPYPNPDEL